MHKIFWVPVIIIATLAFMASCGIGEPGIITGSGQVETRDFNLSGFTNIQASNAFTIDITRADSYKVQITADDNLWNTLDISASGNTLHLRAKPGVNITNWTVKATVTLPSLSILDISGASKVALTGFSSDNNMTFTLSDASTVNISNLRSGSTTFDLSGGSTASGSITTSIVNFIVGGAGKVNLSGAGTDVTIDASGGSHVILNEFKSQNTSATLSGFSEARINTQNIKTADLTGGSNLYYADSPTMGSIQTSLDSNLHQE